ncbi:MAG: hypothetical protein NTY71_07825 [Methanoregula sp.]|jgi:hypothetical protein|nr:hypothetical protein [Methanoregula sp.]
MDNKIFLLITQALPLIVPMNIYVIGDWLGTGIQWALFRYQQTYLGTSLIPVSNDFRYVLDGIMGGRSGVSVLIWCAGAVVLVTALLLLTYALSLESDPRWGTYPPLLSILGGILFIISCIVQYGVLLHSQAGFSIPIGMPIVIILGWYLYRQNDKKEGALSDMEKPRDGE